MLADMNQVYGSIFISKNRKLLVVKGKHSGKWSFPKGHPNEGETGFECARRETEEETGLTLPIFFERIVNLATGSYYIVRSTPEYDTIIRDDNEVSEASWLTVDELKNESINVDVNTFLRGYKLIISNPTKRILTNIPTRVFDI
jgi:8-oxo-dGTP pyrophosphatase MutT (NUDIX family)